MCTELNHRANEGSGENKIERDCKTEMGVVHQFPYYAHNQGPHSQATLHAVVAAAITIYLPTKLTYSWQLQLFSLLLLPWKIKTKVSLNDLLLWSRMTSQHAWDVN